MKREVVLSVNSSFLIPHSSFTNPRSSILNLDVVNLNDTLALSMWYEEILSRFCTFLYYQWRWSSHTLGSHTLRQSCYFLGDLTLSLNSGNLANFSTNLAKQSYSNFATSPIILKSFAKFVFTSHSNGQTET